MYLSEIVEGYRIPVALPVTPISSGFTQTAKAKRVYDAGYTVFDKTIFDDFLDKADETFRDAYRDIDVQGINKYYGDLLRVGVDYNVMSTRIEINKEHDIFSGYLQANRREGLITQRLVQSGLSMYMVSVLECKPEEYTGVVPDLVIKNYEEHKDNFDEVCVIYPENEMIIDINAISRAISHMSTKESSGTAPIDDPILAGKLNSCPGKYFLISYWKEDVDLIKQMSLSGRADIMFDIPQKDDSEKPPLLF